jgi:hypothetical protein
VLTKDTSVLSSFAFPPSLAEPRISLHSKIAQWTFVRVSRGAKEGGQFISDLGPKRLCDHPLYQSGPYCNIVPNLNFGSWSNLLQKVVNLPAGAWLAVSRNRKDHSPPPQRNHLVQTAQTSDRVMNVRNELYSRSTMLM